MAGGLMQLAVYGTQDIFLTGNPQITFFKVIFKRHTNFAMESIPQHFIADANFGLETIAIIDKIGDLMNRVYLEIELPKVDLSKNPGKWTLDRDTAKKRLDQVKNYYDLVYQYIASNTDMARKLDLLLRTNNISMNEIEKTMADSNFVGGLIDLKHRLQMYIDTDPDMVASWNQINQFDIPTIFYSIVRKINNLNVSPEEKSSLKKKEILRAIHKDIYHQMYQFYMNVYHIYLECQKTYQSILNNTYTERYKFAWIEEIGHAIIDQVELRIGGQVMDTHTGDWLILFNKLFLREYQTQNYQKMIGNVSELTIFNDQVKNTYRLIIPFQFWFCRSTGLSLPLVALRYHDVMFIVRLKDLSKLCYVEDDPDLLDMANIQAQYNINISSAKLYVEYIYLDSEERRRFAQSTHEYLVETVQFQEFSGIEGKQFTAHLDFIHPTKFLVWFVQPEYYRLNPSGRNKCQWNNFGTKPNKSGYSMDSTYLRINSYDRTDPALDPIYYNYLQPHWYFSRSPIDGLYVYSFAIKPTEHQPSGSINMGRIDDFSIVSTFSQELVNIAEKGDLEGANTGIFMAVYAVSYNIFRTISGMGGMAFQNIA